MAKFSIIPKGGGTARYSGCPSFTGTYMKPGVLEFREIAVPSPIAWEVGDYVEYTRTGRTYRLYTVPQVKKQARSTEYGGAFVYQSVQFFDDSKQLEICPFRDLVPDDNRIHFSTQPAIAVFDDVAGIAERLQTCLVDMYGANSWVVRVATVSGDGISQDLADLMAEDRDFSVSGVNILQCLDKIYKVWPEVGWVYKIESGTNTIIIGGAGLNTPDSYQYGKGNGLRTITRNVANADELATRIFAYGSSRNMLPRWYNNQTIKDADSVDIQNLMLPVNAVGTQGQAGYYPGWGKTNVQGTNLPDPAKAYIDADDAAMTRLGLRPKTYYFDGSGDLPDIYPTIRKMTVKNVRDALNPSGATPLPQYYPSTSVYTNENQRVDTVLSAPLSFDSGLAGSGGGKETIFTDYKNSTATDSESVSGDVKIYTRSIFTESFSLGSSVAGTRDLSFAIDLSGTVQVTGIKGAKVTAYLRKGHPANAAIISREMKLEESTTAGTYIFVPFTLTGSRKVVEEATYYLVIDLEVELDASSSARTLAYDAVASISASVQNYRETTFKLGIRQIGFDINEQANLGEGKTIAMRSGKCAGRSFQIKNCTYVSATDSWSLDVIRSEDESLSQWFPNTDYPILAGDEFVLLDIAMPDEYILVAERNLLAAAQELLADVSVERWQYTPDIDAKFMVENSRTILPAQNMVLSDADIIGNDPVAVLIDSVTISEGEAAIPTYKVTLRDRKRKTFTESKGADSISSNPVTKSSSQVAKEASTTPSVVSDSYFTLDENGNVTLKEAYQNLWVPGWLADGGIGTGGGGGGSSTLRGLNDVDIPVTPGTNDLLSYNGSVWVNVHKSDLLSGLATTQDLASKQDAYPFTITGVSGQTYDLSNLGVTVDSKDADIGTSLTTIATVGGVDIKAKITHQSLSGYVPTGRTVNGKPLSSDVSIGFSDLSSTPNTLSGYGITDAKIANGTITLGSNTITPLTSFTETDPTVPSWAKASSKPSYSLNEISGTDDLRAIEALTGTSGLLKKTAANTWALDTSTYLPFVGWLGSSDNLNNCTFGSWVYSSSPANYPGSAGGGQLLALGTPSSPTEYGQAQMAINTSGIPFFRIVWGSNWTAWREALVSGSNLTQTIDGAKTFSDNMTLGGTLTLSGSTKKIFFGSFYIELQDLGSGNYALHTNAPFYSDQWIADGGIGSGSGSGGSSTLYGLNDVSIPQPPSSPNANDVLAYSTTLGKWTNVAKSTLLSGYATTASLATVATSGSYNDLTNRPSIPDESTVSGWGFTKNAGTVTSVAMTLPTGLSVSGSPITSSGTLAVTFTNGYSIPTTAKQGNWDTAYSTLTGSQSKNKVFASPSTQSGAPSFRALVAADIPELGAGKITSGTLDFARLPSIYIGRNAATSSAGDVTLLGITGFTTASSASASGDTSLVVWEPNGGGTGVGVWHFKGNIVADGWIADGGIGSGGGGNAGVLNDLNDVTISSPANNDILYYDYANSHWKNVSKATFLSGCVTSVKVGTTSYNPSSGVVSLPAYPTVPTTVSSFTNDAGYITSAALENAVIDATKLYLGDGWLEGGTYPINQTPRPVWKYGLEVSPTTDFVALVSDIPTTLDNISDGSTRSLANYLPLAGGTMTGAITMSGANIVPSADGANKIGNTGARFGEGFFRDLYASYFMFQYTSGGTTTNVGQINFDTNCGDLTVLGTNSKDYAFYKDKFFVRENGTTTAYVDLGTSDHRWKRIYGIDGYLNGDLSLAQTSQITLGPVTISYDATNKALHISGTDNGQTIGIYCDGWIADGGIQQTS